MHPMQAFFTGTLWAMLNQYSRNGPATYYNVEPTMEGGNYLPEVFLKFPKEKLTLKVKVEVVPEKEDVRFEYSDDQKVLVTMLTKAGVAHMSLQHEVRVGDYDVTVFKFSTMGLTSVHSFREPEKKAKG